MVESVGFGVEGKRKIFLKWLGLEEVFMWGSGVGMWGLVG